MTLVVNGGTVMTVVIIIVSKILVVVSWPSIVHVVVCSDPRSREMVTESNVMFVGVPSVSNGSLLSQGG